mgnify:CR=1 FL=1
MEKSKNQVQELIEQIKTLATERGLYLHRYQSKTGGRKYSIIYALHTSAEKPRNSSLCDDTAVNGTKALLIGPEGITVNCRAYAQLSRILAALKMCA